MMDGMRVHIIMEVVIIIILGDIEIMINIFRLVKNDFI